ncbi:Ppx/GppA family phosphatase [Neptunicoccus cionae]|uniref:Exopolyphosphatase n=1 Tax=Neptunicoccus cionae TaxID=2035344 RepID=A0A916VNN6_9RHOB|nr:Ppx/GppA family phosphatase [Amylibacter cionae]GGA13948.1 exopolyphosphatase [Amylibacter cionae]
MKITTKFAALERVGVIDVGSNSVRMVVFDGAARSPAYFYNEKVMCGLGKGMSETGKLNPEGRARALSAMIRFAALAKSFKVQSLTTVATAAVREAEDGPAFCTEVLAKTGIEVTVASGVEEARLSAQGVLLGWPGADGLVSDIGGASMELVELNSGEIGERLTSPLAPLRLAGVEGDLDTHIRDTLHDLRKTMSKDYPTLFLVGGSYRAIAKLDMARRDYPLQVLHEYKLSRRRLAETLDWIETATLDEFRALSSTSVDRLTLVPMAARVLRHLVDVFDPKEVAISSYGLREGLLYEQMPEDLRARDPLIEACLFSERTSARFPGFGAELARWILPLLPDPDRWERITLAAALLHDVSWRSDPSSRAEECFDNASRGNLGGLDHTGRVLLAMALLHRYRKSGKLDKYKALRPLLNDEQYKGAQIIGKAMRLGASLAGGDRTVLRRAKLVQGEGTLELHLPAKIAAFGGEVVETRLAELARSMGLESRLIES